MRLTSSANQTALDWDGVLTFVLSIAVLFLSIGLFWLYLLFLTLRVSRESSSSSSAQLPIIVFGKQLNHNQIDNDFKQRLDCVLALSFNQQPIILLGGITHPNTKAEAQVAFDYLVLHNKTLQPRLILEKNSRNTLENLKQARTFFEQNNLPLQAIFISNRYHLKRCEVLSQNLGFKPEILAAEPLPTLNIRQLGLLMSEAFYLHWFYTGKIFSKIIRNKQMLNKIS